MYSEYIKNVLQFRILKKKIFSRKLLVLLTNSLLIMCVKTFFFYDNNHLYHFTLSDEFAFDNHLQLVGFE